MEGIDRFNYDLLRVCAVACARLVRASNLDDGDREAIRMHLSLLLDSARQVRDPTVLVWAQDLRRQFGDLG